MNTYTLVGLMAVVLLLIVAGLWWSSAPTTEAPVACTMEAMICPDGTAVGRSGPQCEFAPCPTADPVMPQRTSQAGEYNCLKSRNDVDPTTDECVLGLQSDTGQSYGLDFNLLAATDVYSSLVVGDQIEVEGPLIPVEALSTDYWQRYHVDGIISVTSVRRSE